MNDTKDTAYIERANGHWEAWTYADGERVNLGSFVFCDDFYVRYGSRQFRLVIVED